MDLLMNFAYLGCGNCLRGSYDDTTTKFTMIGKDSHESSDEAMGSANQPVDQKRLKMLKKKILQAQDEEQKAANFYLTEIDIKVSGVTTDIDDSTRGGMGSLPQLFKDVSRHTAKLDFPLERLTIL